MNGREDLDIYVFFVCVCECLFFMQIRLLIKIRIQIWKPSPSCTLSRLSMGGKIGLYWLGCVRHWIFFTLCRFASVSKLAFISGSLNLLVTRNGSCQWKEGLVCIGFFVRAVGYFFYNVVQLPCRDSHSDLTGVIYFTCHRSRHREERSVRVGFVV